MVKSEDPSQKLDELVIYRDMPSPSLGFVASIPAASLAPGLLFLFLGAHTLAFALMLTMVPVTLVVLHAALSTEYSMTRSTIEMKAGPFLKAKMPLAEIHSITRVQRMSRLLGRGMIKGGVCSRGFANRYTEGLRLDTTGGPVLVSPSDNTAFISAWRKNA